MRTVLFMLMALLLGMAGCGGDSAPGPTASAGGGAAPPPPPGGAPPPDSPPPEASGQPPAENPPEASPMPGQEGGVPPLGSPDSPPGGASGTPSPETPPDMPPEGSPEASAARQVARVKTWKELGEDALLAGDEQEWFRLVHTIYIVNPRSWSGLDKDMAWVPALRRPALGTRFGIVAVYVNPPKDFEGSPQPIGSAELKTAFDSLQKKGTESGGGGETPRRGKKGKASEEPAAGAEGTGGESPGGNDPTKPGEADLKFHVGEFGTKFVAALQARVDSGAYGNAYRQFAETKKRGVRRSANPDDPNASGEPMPNPAGSTDEGGPGRAEGRQAKAADAGTRLGTAVVWLGKANSKDDLLSLAQKAHVDMLVIYEIAIKTNTKNTLVNNVTKMRVVTVASLAKKDAKEPELFASAGLENRVVLLAREKGGKPDDSVEKEVAHAIDALDKSCKPVALPAGVTGDAIKRRLATQIAEKPADPLPLATEIRYYAVKGLLTPGEATNGTAALLGPAEYAQLVASAPPDAGLEQQVGQAVGRAMSIDGVLDLLSAANSVTGQNSRDEARQRAGKTKSAPGKTGGGLQGLFPFGSGSGAKK